MPNGSAKPRNEVAEVSVRTALVRMNAGPVFGPRRSVAAGGGRASDVAVCLRVIAATRGHR